MHKQYQPICPICKKTLAKNSENVERGQSVRENRQDSGDLVNNYAENGRKIWKCGDCEVPFEGLWAFGWREGTLEKLVEEYKYKSVRATGEVLAEFLDAILPEDLGGGAQVVVVPLPTIGRHVRERGLDHTLVVAKKLAKKRGWKCEHLIVRAADTVQVGAKVAERKTQAGKAYAVKGEVDAKKAYLLLDDVWTTGATMLAAEKVLSKAGASWIGAAVLAVSR